MDTRFNKTNSIVEETLRASVMIANGKKIALENGIEITESTIEAGYRTENMKKAKSTENVLPEQFIKSQKNKI